MRKWEYNTVSEVRTMLEEIAIGIIHKIDKNSDMLTREERYMKISGVLALLDGVCEDMDLDAKKQAEEKKEFEDSCKAAGEAFDNLFDKKTWLVKEAEAHAADS